MPRGIPGSGPNGAKGRGKGRATAPVPAKVARGRAKAHLSGQTADDGNQRAENEPTLTNDKLPTEIGGIKIEYLPIPGRGGRPMQAERYPFADLPVAVRNTGSGEMEGASFVIPSTENGDNVLAAARKRHKGKTFVSRKDPRDGAVRVWREA